MLFRRITYCTLHAATLRECIFSISWTPEDSNSCTSNTIDLTRLGASRTERCSNGRNIPRGSRKPDARKADRQQLLQWILGARLRDLLHQQTPDRLHLPEDYARRIPHSILHFPSVAWHITANDGVGTQGRPERIPATVSGVCYGSSPHWTARPIGYLFRQ